MKTQNKILVSIIATLLLGVVLIGVNSKLTVAAESHTNEIKATSPWGDEIQSEDERQELLEQFKAGRERFAASEELYGTSYHFSRSFASWVGFGYRTTVWVEDNEIVRRSYEEHSYDHQNNENIVEASYDETGDEIGSHRDGFPAQTMYDLYDECSTYLNSDLERYEIWFGADDLGVITSCGRYPYGCADDCSDSASARDFSFDN